jgi:hypothetical protein
MSHSVPKGTPPAPPPVQRILLFAIFIAVVYIALLETRQLNQVQTPKQY